MKINFINWLMLCLLVLGACQDASESDPNSNNLKSNSLELGDVEQNNSDQAFNLLYFNEESTSRVYEFIALDDQWKLINQEQSTFQTQKYTPDTTSCSDLSVPQFRLPSNTSFEILFRSEETPKSTLYGFRQICWPGEKEPINFLPGRLERLVVESGKQRIICSICIDEEGKALPGTAIRFETLDNSN